MVAARDAAGITRIVHASRSAPLQVQRPLYVDPQRAGLATVNVINATAGLFEGDTLSLRVDVLPGAALELRTPAMTRVYTMVDGRATTQLELSAGADTYVESVPAPVILCANAALRQQTRVDLAEGAHAALGEVWAFGRAAHGELHAHRELEARTEIYRDGRLMIADALVMEAGENPGAMVGGHAAYGCLVLVGAQADAVCLARIRELLSANTEITGGASMVPVAPGIAVRALGATAHAVDSTLRAIVFDFRQRCAQEKFDSASGSCAGGG
jgi:urease accessory protein